MSEKNGIENVFTKTLTLEELKEQNKFLSIFESIDEIFEELINLLNKNKIKINEFSNQISIIIPIDHQNLKEIEFSLEETIKNDSEKIIDLFLIILKMKKKIKEFKENINKYDEIINLKKEIKKNSDEIYMLKQELKFLKQEIKKIQI